jgi:thymidine kinase
VWIKFGESRDVTTQDVWVRKTTLDRMQELYARLTSTVEVITGPMYSSKTKALITRYNQVHGNAVAFRPASDSRHVDPWLLSYDGMKCPARVVASSQDILLGPLADLILIDEKQFWDPGLPGVCQELRGEGRHVVLAGLDLDSDGRPWSVSQAVCLVADVIWHVEALCDYCGRPATRTVCLIEKTEQKLCGGKDLYRAACQTCWWNSKTR